MATCQPVAPDLPQMETRDSCSLSSNYMLATRISLNYLIFTTIHRGWL